MTLNLEEEAEEVVEEETTDEEPVEESIDYAAELERVKAEKNNVSGALGKERKLRKEAEAKLRSEEPEADISSVTDQVREGIAQAEKQRILDDVDEMLEDLSDNPSERELIREIYETRIKPSGFSKRALTKDLEMAKLLANKDRYVGSAERKARKSIAEKKALQEAAGTVRKDAPKAEVKEDWSKYNAADQAILRRRGLKPSNVKETLT